MICATLGIDEAASRRWDVVVIGAGVAGATAACLAGRRGASVLLVDRAAFPRHKVCGCCLNAAALDLLSAVGLVDVVGACGARPLVRLHLAAAGRSAELPLPHGAAVSRAALDAALIHRAIGCGVHFLPQTAASLAHVDDHLRRVTLQSAGGRATAAARVVLLGDGLGGRLLEGDDFAALPAPSSRLGASAIIESPESYADGVIHMAVAPGGYVGLVRLEDGRLNVAAAFDPAFVKRHAGCGPAAMNLLRHAGLPPIPALGRARWHGTPLLTRRRGKIAASRLLVIGDAAGYVEPFTGEGMAWAIAGASAVVALALAAANSAWSVEIESRWTHEHARLLHRRQRACGAVASLLRCPRLTALAVAALALAPGLARPLVHSFNAPFQTEPAP